MAGNSQVARVRDFFATLFKAYNKLYGILNVGRKTDYKMYACMYHRCDTHSSWLQSKEEYE